MDATIIWLVVFVGLYWSYCLLMGFKGMAAAKTASDYFISGRKLSLWVFVLAGTATSFSGWTFVGHPGLLYVDGFQYAYASFYAITIPFTGVLFLKRQWMLGKHFGFVTPGEMLSHYFRSDLIRLLVVLVALIFSIPYTGIQFRASGFLFNVLTDGALSVEVGMWLLSAVVLIYVASGGLRSVAYVDSAQAILLALGIVVIGFIALANVGGWSGFTEGIATLAQFDDKRTPEGYSHYVAIPGMIQFVSEGPAATGGAWTGIMILTYMFALMGIQAAPAFSMWAYSNTDPKPFPIQQVWASSLGIGVILMVFTAIQGLGGHLLGANADFRASHPGAVTDVFGPLLNGKDLMDHEGKQGALIPQYINLMGETVPWLLGLLAVCALAAMQSTGAAYMSTAGGMLTRDILKRYLIPGASHAVQKLWGRLGVAFIVVAALTVATTATDALVLLGGLAVAYGFQMWPALIAVCWWPWLTRQGINAGLIAGLVAVTLTENIGIQWFGIEAWGRWPLTIHSAGWGILFNLGLAILVSAFTQDAEDRARRMTFHDFLRQHAGLPADKKPLVPIAWIATLAWFFFAIGPGAVIGNTIFGNPNDAGTWLFGIPSIWAWQLLWWVLGVGMMWFLAIHMRLSTMPEREIEVLREDFGDLPADPR